MPSAPTTAAIHAGASERVNTELARLFYIVGSVLCLAGAAALVFQALPIAPVMKSGLAGACLATAVLFGLAAWQAHRLPPRSSVLGTAWVAFVLVTVIAFGSGFGIQSHDLGFFGVLVCVVAALAGARHGVSMAGAALGVIAAVAYAEGRGWLDGASRVAQAPLSDPIVSQLLLLAAGLGAGLIVARGAHRSKLAIAEREERFHALLGMAADGYFELDSQLRFQPVGQPSRIALAAASHTRIGLRPWETHDKLGIPPELQESHFADLRAHRPFTRLRCCVDSADGSMRHLDVSGEPRFGAGGEFLGYWGVARDVTDEVVAARARRSSEAMLATLFDNSPDCITLIELHSGRYRMANQSCTRVTGYSIEELLGSNVTESVVWHTATDRDQLLEALRRDGHVRGMRCEFAAKSGARIKMLLSATRCVFDGEPHIVINATDVTENERTRLEHEAILKRVSIGIAFARQRRFATVNPSFERMFGWGGGELIGHSGQVLWPGPADYAEVERLIRPAMMEGRPVQLERQMRRKDGSLFWCRLIGQSLDPDGSRPAGTIWTAEDVTERHNAERALAAARDAAEAASRAKSAFLANTSHEIRTPLNGLLGMARLAVQPGVDEERRQQYLNHILDSAQNLAGIISDILDLSKVEAGRVDLERVPFDLREILQSLYQAYQSLAEAKGLVLRLDADVPAHVTGDPLRVRQVLGNFVSNAIKFTASGQVRIEARRAAGGVVRFAVIDTGPGIAPDVQSRLFQPFTQADESTTRRFGGTGLGLSICRELTRLMGGEVGLHSVPGEGSTFWAELPLADTDAAPAPDAPAGAVHDPLRGVRVLVAEDNPVNMLITVALLEQWGVEVTQAHDGRAAVTAVHEAARAGRPFDVVLMDMHMPQMSGDAAARALREHFDAERLPIIALTAAALVSERDEALRAGMCDFLTKPIDPDLMRRALARQVRRATAAG